MKDKNQIAPARILVVDDEQGLRDMVSVMLTHRGYDVSSAEHAEMGLRLLSENSYDVILSDICMPGLSGIDLLKKVRDLFPDILVILMTGNPTLDTATAAVRAPSAVDYLRKPFDSQTLLNTVERAVETKQMRDENKRLTEQNLQYQNHLEEMVKSKSEALLEAYGELERSYDFSLEALVAMLDTREEATGKHSVRVRDLAAIVGRAMNLSKQALKDLAHGTLLHDIGKIGTPDSILLKPGKLTEEEWAIMRGHVRAGYNIVRSSEYLAGASEVILQHHEKFDGSGYPDGLKGEAICLGARIFCIVDAYDAMRSVRPYKEAMSREDSVEELKRCRGTHFDPALVEVFLSVLDEIEATGGWNAS